MEKTLLGVVRVDPRRVLHDGLRAELVRRLSETLDGRLVFPAPPRKARDARAADAAQFHAALAALAADVAGFRRAVEYVQDYIDIAGLKRDARARPRADPPRARPRA